MTHRKSPVEWGTKVPVPKAQLRSSVLGGGPDRLTQASDRKPLTVLPDPPGNGEAARRRTLAGNRSGRFVVPVGTSGSSRPHPHASPLVGSPLDGVRVRPSVLRPLRPWTAAFVRLSGAAFVRFSVPAHLFVPCPLRAPPGRPDVTIPP